MKNFFEKYALTLEMLLASIIFTILVMNVDVQTIGPQNTSVGFANVNGAVHNLTGVNENFYNLTQVIGIVSIMIAATYGAIGALQLFKRKSLLKVDKEIIMLGIIYIITISIYFISTKISINYRPILEDGIIEYSYPSSHTVLAICVLGCGMLINNKKFNEFKFIKIVNSIFVVLMIVAVIGRLLSGYHWLTDIIGGCLIASTLISLYKTLIENEK